MPIISVEIIKTIDEREMQKTTKQKLVKKDHKYDWNALFEKCCDFYPNNFKFCAVKKNYNYLQRYCTEIWKCYS